MWALSWLALDAWQWTTTGPGNDVFAAGPHLSHGRELLASRAAGVGVGVFLIFFFLALSVVICIFGSWSKYRWAIYTASTALFGIVALILLASPKGSKPARPAEGYDRTIVPLVVIMALTVVGVLAGAVGLLVFHVLPPLYARPLSYHLDVMQQRD
ncbi:hypothetical protein Agub_g13670 [Astrephomene gubernaculifera]|uniref:Transmembrane protein 218 n=1 Tax=Astrephomene gubernaculifera TaxID=47775 RepID=A0AAD3HSH8_9CHLO|nr:hypothetical protein Agub_g13670 [Astrephomene gubernaculifera]